VGYGLPGDHSLILRTSGLFTQSSKGGVAASLHSLVNAATIHLLLWLPLVPMAAILYAITLASGTWPGDMISKGHSSLLGDMVNEGHFGCYPS